MSLFQKEKLLSLVKMYLLDILQVLKTQVGANFFLGSWRCFQPAQRYGYARLAKDIKQIPLLSINWGQEGQKKTTC